MTEDRVGKSFIVILTNGDLPTNPMSLRECAVCGKVFTREQSREHYYVPCPPSSEQSHSIASEPRGRFRMSCASSSPSYDPVCLRKKRLEAVVNLS